MRVKKTEINIKVKTGLHIGGSDSMMRIGGVDSEVIKREVYCDENGKVTFKGKYKISEPYIPGSSLKGKLRSLLESFYEYHEVVKELRTYFETSKKEAERKERKDNKQEIKKLEDILNELKNIEGNPINNSNLDFIVEKLKSSKKEDGNTQYFEINNKQFKKFNEKTLRNIIKLFGSTDDNGEIGVTRLIVEDSFISEDIRKRYVKKEIELFEEKSENSINRITGRVNTKGGGVRNIERVVPGVEFKSTLILRVFEGDDEQAFEELIKRGVKLLERDYLGGSGSRGYGRVEINEIKFEDENFDIGNENEASKT